jgi:hypothetical protein
MNIFEIISPATGSPCSARSVGIHHATQAGRRLEYFKSTNAGASPSWTPPPSWVA